MRRGRRRERFITAGAMMAAPARLLIETLLLPRYTVPTNVMQTIVVADRFDDVRGLSIATFATIDFLMCSRNHHRVWNSSTRVVT